MAIINGTSGNDSLLGTASNDVINPGLGNDTVDGGAGSDLVTLDYSTVAHAMRDPVIFGTFDPVAGSGRLDDATGINSLIFSNIERFNVTGTAFDDGIEGVSGNDTLHGGLGNDTLHGNAGDDTLDGGEGDNRLFGGTGNDSLTAGTGNDSLDGGLGNDTMIGGAGNDTFVSGGGVDSINGGTGTDSLVDADLSSSAVAITIDNVTTENFSLPGVIITSIEQFQNVTTGSGNDSLSFPGGVSNVVSTGTGNDTINPGLGNDTVDGGAGSDLLNLDYSAATNGMRDPVIFGTFDPVAGSGRLDDATGINSLIFSNIERFNVTGSAFNDAIEGVSGSDTLSGGLGNDTLHGNAGDDILDDGEGDNRLFGGDGNDSLTAGTGNDSLDGGLGNDTMIGGDGNDTFVSGGGVDSMDGGTGTDSLVDADLSSLAAAVTIDNVTTENFSLPGVIITSIEQFQNVTTGSGNDSLSFPGGVSNVVSSGTGNDTISPGLGNDTVDGGAGSDLLSLDYSAATNGMRDPVIFGTFDPVAGSGRLDDATGINSLIFSNIERFNVTGSAFNDAIEGVSGSDTLSGGLGNDTLHANAGDDNLDGGEGDNRLFGGDGNDSLTAGTGNDSLDGGLGNDTMIGGAGNDTFVSGGGVDSIDGGTGTDSLVDADLSSSASAILINNVTSKNFSLPGVIITNIEQFQNVTTGSGNDSLSFPGGVSNVVSTGTGNDTINPGLGNDTVDGGAGSDLLNLDYSAATNGMRDPVIFGTFDPVAGSGRLDDATGTNSLTFSNIEVFSVTGSAFNDAIEGVGGNDTLRGGNGNDTLRGNAGDDSLSGSAGDNRIFGGTGNDSLTAAGGNDSLDGGLGNDTMIGGAGNDTFVSGGGVDSIDGGTGTDSLVDADLSSSAVAITIDNVTTENFSLPGVIITSIEQFQNVTTGSGNDSLSFPGGVSNVVSTGTGNDTINPGLGNDTVDGGAGSDLLSLDYSAATNGMRDPVIFGTFDPVAGSGRLDDATGINSLTFSNIERFNVTGSAFNDAIEGVSGDDTLSGGNGNDSLLSNAGNDSLLGGSGDDFLNGGVGNDTMSGGTGNDTFTSGSGVDSIDGGTGTDLLVDANFSSATAAIVLNNVSAPAITLPNGAVVSGVEQFQNVTTGSGSDSLSFPGVVNNNISTGSGSDTIAPGLGNDTVAGGTGSDLLNLDYSAAANGMRDPVIFGTFDPVAGNGHLDDATGANSLVFSAIERFNTTGTAFNDSIQGVNGNDTLRGGAGDDSLTGNGGNDSIDGGTGNDTMTGGSGNDTYIVDSSSDIVTENASGGTDLIQSSATFAMGANVENLTLTGAGNVNGTGNAVANKLTGNTGANILDGTGALLGVGETDTLTGGTGADVFVLGSAAGRYYDDGNGATAGTGDYADVADLNRAQGDKLQLKGTAADYLLGTNPVVGLTGKGIFFDSDGSHTLTASDELIAVVKNTGVNLGLDVNYV